MYLVLIDATTKWLEVHPMQAITASKTIEILSSIFATHGLPRKVHVVSDNGPTFTSSEFGEFMSKNGIHHIFSSPLGSSNAIFCFIHSSSIPLLGHWTH